MSEAECLELFRALFPGGLQDPSLVEALAPEGWERSPLVKVAHPDPETVIKEQERFRKNLERLTRNRPKQGPLEPPPEPASTEPEDPEEPLSLDPTEECGRLLGYALWDIFSDNHEVLAPDGRVVDIGSFRGAAGFISDFFHAGPATPTESIVERLLRADYMEFYMGSAFAGSRADLTPVYEYIFRLLKRQRCDWRYSFPRIHIFHFEGKEDDDADYPSPSERFARDEEARKRRAEFEAMQRQLNEAAEQTRTELLKNPPKTVLAYREVFHRDPLGWNTG